MWPCAVQILLCALEAEDVELLRREDGLPLLLRLVHGPWRRGRRRHRRHAGQPPSRRAAAGEGARRREDSGREARGATAAVRGHECDAILSPSRRWTPMLSCWLLSGLCGVDMRSESRWSFPLWKESGSEDNRFGSSPDPACLPAGLPGLGLGCSSTRTRRPRHLLSI